MFELSIVVVGAGVVGASVALALQRDGHQVTLVDREAPCAGASFGNAGAIVDRSCVPTAMPGIALDALRMLGNPLAPLSIRPAYLHKALPWLIRFVLESRRSRVAENATNLHAISSRSIAGWRELTDGTNLSGLLREGGWLEVYETSHSFAATLGRREIMDAQCAPYDILDAGDIRDLEPHLAAVFEHGILRRNCLWVSNPQRMVTGMVDLLVAQGGTFCRFDAQSIDIGNEQIVRDGSGTSIDANKVVIAAGAWSKSLAGQAGDKLPLEAERGYHIMLGTRNSRLLSRPVLNGESSFVLVPMESGLRMTCQVELAGVNGAADYRRIRRMLPLAKKMVPEIDATEESVWMGCRPSLPDSLPVIGFARRSKNILYAFGHQHLGMTLGPSTGLIIADLIAGRDPGIDLAPYRPDRY